MEKQPTTSNVRQVFTAINKMRQDGVVENYAAGGAVASAFYLEPVNSVDVDIFVTLKPYQGKHILTLEPIYDYLTAMGAKSDGEHIVYAGWPLHFLPANSPLVVEAFNHAREFDADGVPIRVFGLEHLAAIALEVGRLKDKVRLDGFASSHAMNMKKFKAILHRHNLGQKYEDWLKWRKNA